MSENKEIMGNGNDLQWFYDMLEEKSKNLAKKIMNEEKLATEVIEEDNCTTLKVSVPGVKSEAIELTVVSGLMNTYDVKLKIFSNYDEKLFFISPGDYEMSVIGIFDEENITASLEKGVLTVVFPNKNREIPINIESK
jgi:HSP20 family molecular chaperone IbpA